MKTDTPSLETPQAARLRRRQLIRQLLERDKTPLAILFMAAVVGTLVGLAAVAFDKGVAWLQNQRMGALVHTADNYPLLLTVAFLCSAVLAMFGYFLVRKYAPMVLGREGPTVQIGGNIGRMVLDIFRLKGDEARHTLLATGAAAGLAAAFNAPLAGILFIIEEMRPQFRY
ncbi:MAG: chloride channel protein, partial [Escherichia coli]|nr:chloride channel protein [Escherichia coli]